MRATEPQLASASVHEVDDILDALPGDRVATGCTATERLIELYVILLRNFHVHNVHLVVVRLKKVFEPCTSAFSLKAFLVLEDLLREEIRLNSPS